MIKFTDDDILRIDEHFAQEGIPFHARPFHAAKKILGTKFSIGFGQDPLFDEIVHTYERLIPEVKFTWPGMGTGLVASLDRVKKVTVGIAFGTVNLKVYKGLGFSTETEWFDWCRKDYKIAANSAFAFADMHDLVYGINENITKENNSLIFWGLAAEQMKLVSESLSQSGSISSSVLQPICLTAELSMKGTLLHLGIPERDLRNPKLFGHNLFKLGEKMVQVESHKDDQLLLGMLNKFPNYVEDRYRETQLTRLEAISIALSAQFIAASAVRRVSGRDLSSQIENSEVGLRSNYFS